MDIFIGPILFIFYINDIFNTINHVKMTMFADDCVIYYSGNTWPNVKNIMQSDFDKIVEWTYRNNLRLNCSKTKAMSFGSRNKLSKIINPEKFNLDNRMIDFVHSFTYLGNIIDDVMSLDPLLNNMRKVISNKMFVLRKISKYLTFEACVLVYKQTILPIMDYPGFMITACRKGDREDLQTLQNDILRICNMTRISDKVSIVKLHEKCKIIGLEQRQRKQLLRLMYLLSKDENYLHVPGRITRNANRIIFRVPNRPRILTISNSLLII